MASEPTSHRPGRARRLQLAALAALLLIGGIVLLIIELDRLDYYQSLSDWPTTEGTIRVSEVIGERAFRPHLIYDYEINQTVYTDSSFLDMPSFGGRRSRKDAAEKKAEAYPVGSPVTIHYNPQNPAESKIKINAPWSVYGQLGLAGFLIILGLVTGGFSIRGRQAVAPAVPRE